MSNVIGLTLVVEVSCFSCMILSNRSVPVFLKSLVWLVRVVVLPDLLNVGLVGVFWVHLLVQDSCAKPSFNSVLPFWCRMGPLFNYERSCCDEICHPGACHMMINVVEVSASCRTSFCNQLGLSQI